ncbi:MAG: hypothetical protein ACFFCS_17900 [Candidatus Hodarchaeota archaeon]
MKRSIRNEKTRRFFVPGLIIGLITLSLVGVFTTSNMNHDGNNDTHAINEATASSLNILFLTESDDSKVEKALELDEGFSISKNTPVNATFLIANGFKAVVICDYGLSADEIDNLTTYFENGGKLFIIFGPNSNNTENLLLGLNISVTMANSNLGEDNSIGINYMTGAEGHPLVQKIQWSSCPSIRNFTNITSINATNGTNLLTTGSSDDSPLFYSYQGVNGSEFLLFTPWVVPGGNNLQVELWLYFNYFIYLSTAYLTTNTPDILPSFSEWAHSPVPHATDTIIIAVIVIALGIIAFSLFFYQRQKSKKTQIVLSEKALEEITKEKEKEKIELEDLTDKWEQVGTHRQISGFMFGLFAGIILGIPQIVLTGIIFPRWIMPFPFIAGSFDWVKQFFQAIWMVFDVGTSIALAKYFAQYRIKQPKKAIHYIQIFVWWQMLSGVVQIMSISLIGSIVFPQTNFAHLSWLVVLHSLIQYPGFFVVFMYIFQGMQRTDLHNLGNLLYQAILMLGCQYIFILLFRNIFANNPQGEAFGAMIGYAVGQYVAEWGIFFIMMKFYKNLGFSLSTIFRADFTGKELKEALVFGGKETMGHVWVPLAYMYQVWLLGAFLPNYNEQMGLFGYANMLSQVIYLVAFLVEGFLAPVSEAHSHKKQQLLKLNLAQGMKWANYMIFFMIVLLAAVGDKFIAVIGSQWASAARFIPLLLVYSIMQPWTQLADRVLQGTGFTGRAAIIWFIEQGGKMALLTIYISLGITDIMIILYAHVPVLVIKTSLGWFTIRRKIAKTKPYFWNTWIAPGIASIIIYFTLWGMTFILTGWLILVEFVLAIFLIFYVYTFLCGFLGCYDENTIEEFKKAAEMVKVKLISGLSKTLYRSAALGCRLSPGLHGRFPLENFNEAMEEARELEKEKLKLEI